MKKLFLLVLMLVGVVCLVTIGNAATLENGDSEAYDYKLTSEGEDPNNNVVLGRIDDRCKISICKFGCEVTLVKTGQTITVGPDDHVIIDKGVMRIK